MESSKSSDSTTHLDAAQKGIYAFIGAIGIGVIAILFIFIVPNSITFIGLASIGMFLLGFKAVFLMYPRIAVLSTTSLNVKTYFLTGIFIMAWIIFMAWAFRFMDGHSDFADNNIVAWVEIVGLSILTAVSVSFLMLTMAKR